MARLLRPLFGAALLAVFAPFVVVRPAAAQDVRTKIRNVFHFGECDDLICLSLSTGEHGNHYNPDAQSAGTAFISFLGSAIATSVANVPLGATSSGTTFTFDATGAPVATSQSTGPIFGERSQTLGRGRVLIGVNGTRGKFQSLRGVDLDRLRLTLTHSDEDPPGLGDPALEQDTIHIETALDASLSVFAVYATFGLSNQIDVGIAVPFVSLSFDGRSIGTLVSTAGFPFHYFAGTAADPQQVDTATSSASASGLGDVSLRAKFNLVQSERGGAAFLTDVRLPTGAEEDLLGAGEVSVHGIFISSARFGQFSPHVNVGYLWRSGQDRNSAALGTVGFDALVAPRLTVAADFIGQWQIGDNKVRLPEPAVYVDGSVITRTNIPDRRDNVIGAALGAKYVIAGDITAVGNVIMPLADGGMRPSVTWTFGLERTF